MAEWYWRRTPVEKIGPRSTEEVRAALVAGLLEPGHEVWQEGWDAWARIEEVEEFRGIASRPPLAAPPNAAGGRTVPLPDGLRGWMSFVGIMNILGGLLLVLSCVGLIKGILLLVMGFAALGARSALDAAGGGVPVELQPFLGKLKTFFVAQGLAFVLALVFLAGIALLWFLGMLGAFAGRLGHF